MILAFTPEASELPKDFRLYVNGKEGASAGPIVVKAPAPAAPAFGFRLPLAALHDGDNLVEVTAAGACTITWAEIDLVPAV